MDTETGNGSQSSYNALDDNKENIAQAAEFAGSPEQETLPAPGDFSLDGSYQPSAGADPETLPAPGDFSLDRSYQLSAGAGPQTLPAPGDFSSGRLYRPSAGADPEPLPARRDFSSGGLYRPSAGADPEPLPARRVFSSGRLYRPSAGADPETLRARGDFSFFRSYPPRAGAGPENEQPLNVGAMGGDDVDNFRIINMEGSSRSEDWTREETLIMLRVKMETQSTLGSSKKRGESWSWQASKALEVEGFYRLKKACEQRWDTLMKLLKKSKIKDPEVLHLMQEIMDVHQKQVCPEIGTSSGGQTVDASAQLPQVNEVPIVSGSFDRDMLVQMVCHEVLLALWGNPESFQNAPMAQMAAMSRKVNTIEEEVSKIRSQYALVFPQDDSLNNPDSSPLLRFDDLPIPDE